jgi:predicted XRE-type DNA-binding protein
MITYRVDADAVVVVEVLPDRLEFRKHVALIYDRLRDYDQRRARLEGSWWQVGEVGDFLQLTPQQAAFVGMKVALADQLALVRRRRHWRQVDVATRLRSSQPRVAMMELADSSVSIDLLIKSLLTLGVSRAELAQVIAGPG